MRARSPIYLFTDFGLQGPYVGQLRAAIYDIAPAAPVIDLIHDAPAMRPDLAAWLLPAICNPLPKGGIVAAIVDPGVGSSREALVVETPERVFVGPDNGLFQHLPDILDVNAIRWRPPGLSNSFHGRDLFAPVAAKLHLGETVEMSPTLLSCVSPRRSAERNLRVVYIDAYGNLMIAGSENKFKKTSQLRILGDTISYAETFSAVPDGRLFWYFNSQGLLEIAMNQGSAAQRLSLALGDELLID